MRLILSLFIVASIASVAGAATPRTPRSFARPAALGSTARRHPAPRALTAGRARAATSCDGMPAGTASFDATISFKTSRSATDVFGTQNNAVGNYSGAFEGGLNTVCSTDAAIVAGQSNVIDGGNDGFIGAGGHNSVTGENGFIGAGEENAVSNTDSAVVSGGLNMAEGSYDAIVAGYSNTASSTGSFVGAGSGNVASGPGAFVGAGNANAASGKDSFIGGGGSGTSQGATNNQASGDDSFIGAGEVNVVSGSLSSIGAGYSNHIMGSGAFIGAGSGSSVSAQGGFVGAGNANVVSGEMSFIGGGGSSTKAGATNNTVAGNDAFVGAGLVNSVLANEAFIGAGGSNMISSGGTFGSIIGGNRNTVSAEYASIIGGFGNTASGSYAIVAGGDTSQASGIVSFAAGYHAHAAHNGSFVWSDYSSGSKVVADTAANQFVIRASGGTTVYSNEAATAGVKLAAGSGTWASLSDRSAKTDIAPLDDASVLAKVDALPISTWRYKSERGVRHAGPMAQDFYNRFGIGEDDRHIASIDESAVGLASIKALSRQMSELRDEIRNVRAANGEISSAAATLRNENTALRSRIAALEHAR